MELVLDLVEQLTEIVKVWCENLMMAMQYLVWVVEPMLEYVLRDSAVEDPELALSNFAMLSNQNDGDEFLSLI